MFIQIFRVHANRGYIYTRAEHSELVCRDVLIDVPRASFEAAL